MNKSTLLDELINDYIIILNIVTVEELDHLKQNPNMDISHKAKRAIRSVRKYEDKIVFDREKRVVSSLLTQDNIQDFNYNDNIIISCALFNNAYILSDDYNVEIKAKALGINVLNIKNNTKDYTGYIDRIVTDEELSENFTNRSNNIYNCLTNEYVVLRNELSKVVAIMKWDGNEYKNISYKTFNSDYMGMIEPVNLQQKLAFDMLQDNKITIKVLSGGYGTGRKSLLV